MTSEWNKGNWKHTQSDKLNVHNDLFHRLVNINITYFSGLFQRLVNILAFFSGYLDFCENIFKSSISSVCVLTKIWNFIRVNKKKIEEASTTCIWYLHKIQNHMLFEDIRVTIKMKNRKKCIISELLKFYLRFRWVFFHVYLYSSKDH
jgi:hypothetical protein